MSHRQTHRYGDQVRLLKNPFCEGLLSRLCSPECVQPEINRLVERLYRELLISVINEEFPLEQFRAPTRMTSHHPEVQLSGERVHRFQRAIVVNLARAGTYPSHVCFEVLHDAIAPEYLRQDHVFASRKLGKEDQVSGTDLGSSKIGGDQDSAIVLFPDPMGATGGTMNSAVDHYKKQISGVAEKHIAMHLIVTPEYLRKVTTAHPDLIVYAFRLDRGLSSEAVLATEPGTLWDQEKGLTEKGYIVPGGGGFGEIMNNSFV